MHLQLSCFLVPYSVSALLAMQSAVIARWILSVCLSDFGTVSIRMKIGSFGIHSSGRTIPLVSGELNFIRIFAGDHPQWGR